MKPFYFEYCSTESNKTKWCEIDYQMNLHVFTKDRVKLDKVENILKGENSNYGRKSLLDV